MPTLSDLYNADQRTHDTKIRETAEKFFIPHPLNNVQYSDVTSTCRHSKKHSKFQSCRQEVRPS
jgi:hypothetical protein